MGCIVGNKREAPRLGFALGALLGPFGVIAAGLIDGRQKCFTCMEPVGEGAKQCPHCQTVFQTVGEKHPDAVDTAINDLLG